MSDSNPPVHAADVPAEALPDRLRPGVAWYLLAIPALGVAGYAIALQDGRPVRDAVPGLPWFDELHFAAGGVALAAGIFGFRRDLLARRTELHRALGYVYVAAVTLSALPALAMAVWSMGGIAAHTGFALLGLFWFATTMLALARIRARDVRRHRTWIVRSYALCYAAVTLRIELPLLVALTGSFERAFPLVAWLCWVPNLLLAELWLRRTDLSGRLLAMVPRRGLEPPRRVTSTRT